jgi:hypothetical protein
MSKISKSPDRHSFQKGGYVKRMEETGEPISEAYLDMFDNILNAHEHKFDDPASHVNNMEYDLLITDWILEKVRTNDSYAQNLYAAMCNNDFIRMEVIPIIRQDPDKDFWHASWRYAGGIIADMQQKGDYIDWYCSGMGGLNREFEGEEANEQWRARTGYVPEGYITDEIRSDLQRLGWAVAPGGDWEKFNQGV